MPGGSQSLEAGVMFGSGAAGVFPSGTVESVAAKPLVWISMRRFPKNLAARLRPEIQELAKLKYRSSADAERYVRDLSRNILKILPRADKS